MLACPIRYCKGFRIHSRICHIGAECVSQCMGRCYCRQRFLMARIILFYKFTKHNIIVNAILRCFVPCEKEEACITVNLKSAFSSALNHSLQGFKHSVAHGDFANAVFRFRCFNAIGLFTGILKLMIHIDCPVLM